MYKNVDEEGSAYEGFSYKNLHGHLEYVKLLGDYNDLVEISLDLDGPGTEIYKKDIPKLIRALQAAYDYKGN
ncbi:MAG: hypothetical protein ACXW1D_00850 [Halobacteriota archaeon]